MVAAQKAINSAVNQAVDDHLKELTYPNAKKFDLMGDNWVAKMLKDMGHAPESRDGGGYSSGDLARTRTKNATMMQFSDSD